MPFADLLTANAAYAEGFEHRDLDDVISRLSLDLRVDEIQLKRLKKRKLLLRDQIERFESQMIPDLNA